jgi:hypothetical protein
MQEHSPVKRSSFIGRAITFPDGVIAPAPFSMQVGRCDNDVVEVRTRLKTIRTSVSFAAQHHRMTRIVSGFEEVFSGKLLM